MPATAVPCRVGQNSFSRSLGALQDPTSTATSTQPRITTAALLRDGPPVRNTLPLQPVRARLTMGRGGHGGPGPNIHTTWYAVVAHVATTSSTALVAGALDDTHRAGGSSSGNAGSR